MPGDYPTIQEAIDAAAWVGDVVLVEPGTYGPISFKGKWVGVHSTQGPEVTTIMGDVANWIEAVRFWNGEYWGAVLDGFTVTGGGGKYGGGISITNFGGKVYCEIRNCIIIGNTALADTSGPFTSGGYGAGIYVYEGGPQVENCLISGNFAERSGGGIFVADSANPVATFRDCRIIGNTSAAGGGLYTSVSTPVFERCVFSGNLALDVGGAVASIDGGPRFDHCTFNLNFASTAGGGFALIDIAYPEMSNSILWGNVAPVDSQVHVKPNCWNCQFFVAFSDVQGGWPGTGNLAADPLWWDAAVGDLRLLPGSPCIDAADPAAGTDPDGSIGDMGAVAFLPVLPYGAGCGGLVAGWSGLPIVGQVGFAVSCAGAPGGAPAVFLAGVSSVAWSGVPLPLDLSNWGASGCSLLTSVEAQVAALADGAGSVVLPVPIPPVQALMGAEVFAQWIVLSPSANPLGMTLSDALSITLQP